MPARQAPPKQVKLSTLAAAAQKGEPLCTLTGPRDYSDADGLIERLAREGKAAVNEAKKELGDEPMGEASYKRGRDEVATIKEEDAGFGDMSDEGF